MEEIHETKNLLLEKIHKTDKFLVRLKETKKKDEKAQIINIKNELGNAIDFVSITWMNFQLKILPQGNSPQKL